MRTCTLVGAEADDLQSDGFSIPQSVLKYHDLASSPYTETTCRAINSRRESMPESKLFLDQLLAFANVDGMSNSALAFLPTSTDLHH